MEFVGTENPSNFMKPSSPFVVLIFVVIAFLISKYCLLFAESRRFPLLSKHGGQVAEIYPLRLISSIFWPLTDSTSPKKEIVVVTRVYLILSFLIICILKVF